MDRSRELRARREELLQSKKDTEKALADALAAGKPAGDLPAKIAALAAELEGVAGASALVDGAYYRLKRQESLADAEHVAENYLKDFEKDALPRIMDAAQRYGEWLQADTLATLKGEPRTPAPTAGALDAHGIKDPLMLTVLCANMMTRTRPQPEPAPEATPEELAARPERRIRFGKDAVVSNGRGPVKRIDGTSDSGDIPGQAESRHGLGIREIQVPGPRY